MAGSMNRAILIGRVGKDPEMRDMKDGRRIATLRLATSETWKDKNSGERKEATEWHSIVVFADALSKVVEAYVKKGDLIAIEGSIHTRKWQDQAGQDRYSTEIVLKGFADRLTMLESRSTTGQLSREPQDPVGGQTLRGSYRDEARDEVPF